MKTLITGALQLNPEQLQMLEAQGLEITLHPDERAEVPHPEVYEAVVCNGLFLYHPIEQFTALRRIQLTSAGYDRVPLDYIRAHGIELRNAAGVYSVPMAEFAIGGILQLYKQSAFFRANQSAHRWEKHRGLLELAGKTVCIAGTGDVGREIAKRLKAFDCEIIGVNRTVRTLPNFNRMRPLSELPAASRACDILIVSMALAEETRGIIDQCIFDGLRPGAVVVNVSRGALIDESALIAWLRSERSGGAVLDVFEQEPLPESSPLWDMEHVILTPHNSFVGEHNQERMWETITIN
ncbi:MAG: NAD(P)-dependent oxidoreductase [Oscillospiraceae bacterium]